MADPILPPGFTVIEPVLPPGFTAVGPDKIDTGLMMSLTNPILAPLIQAGKHAAPETTKKVTDWAATQGVKGLTSIAGIPRAIGDVYGDWRQNALGLPRDRGPITNVPGTQQMNATAFGPGGVDETHLPGRTGRVVDAGVQALVGGAPFGPAALLPSAVSGAGAEIGGQLTEGTPYETWARLAGGVVGGVGGALGQTGLKYAGQGAKSLVEPFTEGGRNAIVGRTLNKAASDPATAIPRMQGSQPTVPGSLPTAAQAANDPGMLAIENALKGRSGDQFAMRAAESNAARIAAADKVSPTVTADVAGDTMRGAMQSRKNAAEALREKVAGPKYQAARASGDVLDAAPILQSIKDQIGTETGPIRNALKLAQSSLYIGGGDQPRRLASNVAEMQAVKRALDAQIGNVAPTNKTLKAALVGIRNQVDDALKSNASFREADEAWAQLSGNLRPYDKKYGPVANKALETGPYDGPYVQPSGSVPDTFLKRGPAGVDQLLAAAGPKKMAPKQAVVGQLMDDFKSAVRTTADDPLGNKTLSAAAADRWWQANKDTAAKVMTPAQVKGMQTIVDDFAMGARRPQGVAGSNTAQNLASGNMLNAILRFRTLADSTGAQTITRPLQFLYKLPEEKLQEALLNAMMDPKVASALMIKANASNAHLLAPMLRQALLGTSAGEIQATDRSQ